MANNAATTATNAEKSTTNEPGMCLMWARERAAIGSLYNDAATAWRNTNDRRPGDRNPPRGAAVYWTGGSKGYGHIAISLGNGKVRSTDAGGKGKVATIDLGWVEKNWGMPYAGWAKDINEVTIPEIEEDDMALSDDDIRKIAKAVWEFGLAVYDTEDPDDKKMAKVILSQTHTRAGKAAGYNPQ